MKNYRLYLLRDGHIWAGRPFAAFSDEEAVEVGGAVFDGCSDVAETCEVWQGDKLKVALGPDFRRAPCRLEDLVAARQRNVVELEEALCNSFTCIRESMRLLDRLSHCDPWSAGPNNEAK